MGAGNGVAGAGVTKGLIVFLVSGKYISEADLENPANIKKKNQQEFELLLLSYIVRDYIFRHEQSQNIRSR